MRDRMEIRVKAVQDRVFKDSYWSYDIKTEIQKAFELFERKFPVRFLLTEEIGNWESIGGPRLITFPSSFIQMARQTSSIRSIIDVLLRVAKERMNLILDVSEEEKDEICDILKDQSPQYQFGFLDGKFQRLVRDCFMRDLMIKEPISSGIDAVIAFTGKITPLVGRFNSLGFAMLNSVFGENAYVLLGMWLVGLEPSLAILHEIGHLFGAQDIKDSSISSVMTQNPENPSYRFDRKNRKKIFHKLEELRVLKKK